MALPNPPSTGGALAKHLGQVAALERRQEAEEDAAAAAAAAAEAEASAALPDAAAGAAATPDAAGAEGGQEGLGGEAAAEPAACSKLEQWGEELEASDVAAAEAAEAAARRFRPDRSTPDSARLDAQAVREEAAAVAAQRRGMRPPSLLAHLAHIHAYAKAGQLEGLFGAVEAMQQVGRRGAAAGAAAAAVVCVWEGGGRCRQQCRLPGGCKRSVEGRGSPAWLLAACAAQNPPGSRPHPCLSLPPSPSGSHHPSRRAPASPSLPSFSL